jgi:hypothetical protein
LGENQPASNGRRDAPPVLFVEQMVTPRTPNELVESPDWIVVDSGGARIVEGRPDRLLLDTSRDTNRLIEIGAEAASDRLLLYPANLPLAFFDLSSGDAGAVLQKLRQYGVRLAVVCAPGGVRFSSRFGEAVAEERDRGWFGLFTTRDAALAWLAALDGR